MKVEFLTSALVDRINKTLNFNLITEPAVMLDNDHKKICKLGYENDQLFWMFQSRLSKQENNAMTTYIKKFGKELIEGYVNQMDSIYSEPVFLSAAEMGVADNVIVESSIIECFLLRNEINNNDLEKISEMMVEKNIENVVPIIANSGAKYLLYADSNSECYKISNLHIAVLDKNIEVDEQHTFGRFTCEQSREVNGVFTLKIDDPKGSYTLRITRI